MLPAVYVNIEHYLTYYPTTTALLTIFVCISTIFLVIQEILVPVGKRRPPPGKKWRLPPGPKGIPIFGSLLDLKSARGDPDNKIVSAAGSF
jgi:hypothetical protein